MDEDWAEVWPIMEDAFEGDSLRWDMREESVDIIFEYMSLYEEYAD
jgi:hypothetical protein